MPEIREAVRLVDSELAVERPQLLSDVLDRTLSSQRMMDNNRKAKFYSISKAGGKHLVTETQHWERVSGIIGKLLQLGTRG